MRELGRKPEEYRFQEPCDKRRGPIVINQSNQSTTGFGKMVVFRDRLPCHLFFWWFLTVQILGSWKKIGRVLALDVLQCR